MRLSGGSGKPVISRYTLGECLTLGSAAIAASTRRNILFPYGSEILRFSVEGNGLLRISMFPPTLATNDAAQPLSGRIGIVLPIRSEIAYAPMHPGADSPYNASDLTDITLNYVSTHENPPRIHINGSSSLFSPSEQDLNPGAFLVFNKQKAPVYAFVTRVETIGPSDWYLYVDSPIPSSMPFTSLHSVGSSRVLSNTRYQRMRNATFMASVNSTIATVKFQTYRSTAK